MTKSGEFFEDRVGDRCPDEGDGTGIVMLDEAIDFADEVGNRVSPSARYPNPIHFLCQ